MVPNIACSWEKSAHLQSGEHHWVDQHRPPDADGPSSNTETIALSASRSVTVRVKNNDVSRTPKNIPAHASGMGTTRWE